MAFISVVNTGGRSVHGATKSKWSIREMLAVRRQRLQLAELNDHLLRDIGITRTDAQVEAARSFWDY